MKNIICNQELQQHIKANLAGFDVQTHERAGLKQAAVAITLVDTRHDPNIYNIPFSQSWAHEAAIVLTQRAVRLRKHAGQWALPGGRMESNENPEETALRELSEEVGVSLGLERVLGRLDDFTTRSGYVITPVVVWGGTDVELTLNPAEVAAVHRIPLREFMRNDSPQLHQIPQSQNPVLIMPMGDSWIAAPTAALIYQFREVALRDNHIRVAHYEQPVFAWQ